MKNYRCPYDNNVLLLLSRNYACTYDKGVDTSMGPFPVMGVTTSEYACPECGRKYRQIDHNEPVLIKRTDIQ